MWAAIVISVLLGAFFTGMEIAFTSANKLHLEIDKQSSPFRSRVLDILTANRTVYIASMFTGYCFSLVVFGIAISNIAFSRVTDSSGSSLLPGIIFLLIACVIFILSGDLAPRIIFKIIPNTLLNFFLIPVSVFFILLYPVSSIFVWVYRVTQKFFFGNKNAPPNTNVFNRDDLEELLMEKEITGDENNNNAETEVQLFKNALDFSKVKLREIMIPRNEMEMMDINETSVSQLHMRFVETGYSRIIFYEQNFDNIIGYIHSSVIFKNPESIRPYLTKVLIVPESMPANRLLSSLIKEHLSIAIVVDEFGGTSGMVTTEDILEEIFGEIEDEHDTIDILEKKLGENSYLFSGRVEIDHINTVYQLGLPDSDDFETLAGFILFNHESVPKINSVIRIGKFQLKILKATNTKIELVKLTIKEE